MIAGIDLSTHAVDIVLLDETTDAATWHRFELVGQDAFDRARWVRQVVPHATDELWDDVLAVGIEQPRGNFGVTHLMRIQGAILACIPPSLLVQPWNPSSWRKAVGLSGAAPKVTVATHAKALLYRASRDRYKAVDWPQDACDAYCIALATRSLLEIGAAA